MTTEEGAIGPFPYTSQHNNRSTVYVPNVDNNMSVAGGLATGSHPHMSVVYPFHNIIYSAEVMSYHCWGSLVKKVNEKLVNNSLTG